MRKTMLLAAMLAMVLAAAIPAFAQAVGGDVSVQYVDCSQVQEAAAVQGQYGDADAEASGIGSASAAEIAQELNITQAQVNACLGEIDVDDDVVSAAPADDDATAAAAASAPAAEAAAAPAASASAAAAASAPAAGITVLPETGGASALALGAGALLIGGGLLIRRMIR